MNVVMNLQKWGCNPSASRTHAYLWGPMNAGGNNRAKKNGSTQWGAAWKVKTTEIKRTEPDRNGYKSIFQPVLTRHPKNYWERFLRDDNEHIVHFPTWIDMGFLAN